MNKQWKIELQESFAPDNTRFKPSLTCGRGLVGPVSYPDLYATLSWSPFFVSSGTQKSVSSLFFLILRWINCHDNYSNHSWKTHSEQYLDFFGPKMAFASAQGHWRGQKSLSPLWKAWFSLSIPSNGPRYGFPRLKIIISRNIYRIGTLIVINIYELSRNLRFVSILTNR